MTTKELLPTYDVYNCKDGRVVMVAATQQGAAAFAGVSESFVINAARRKANNKYGRIATTTGYYFKVHTGIPDNLPTVNLKTRTEKVKHKSNYSEKRWRLNQEKFFARLKFFGFKNVKDFAKANHISYQTVIDYVNYPAYRDPRELDRAMRLCHALHSEPEYMFDKEEVRY